MLPGGRTPVVLHGPGLDNYSSDASDWERSVGPLDSPWLGEDAAGGEARIHIHTATGLLCSLDVVKRDVDQHVWICPRDVKWAIRDKFGVPVPWQTLLHGGRELDDFEVCQELWPNHDGFQEVDFTLVKSMSAGETREHDLIQRRLRLLSDRKAREPAFPIQLEIGGESPEEFCALPGVVWETELQSLSIAHLERLEVIPPDIGLLGYLQVLIVDDLPGLARFPGEVLHCLNLRILTLSHIPCLSTVPAHIDRLRHLEYLVLDTLGCEFNDTGLPRGHVEDLPTQIGALSALRGLHICGLPRLDCLPIHLGQLANLMTLQLEALEELSRIPEEIGGLQLLRQLHVIRCPRVRSLPRGILVQTNVLKLPLQFLIHSNHPNMAQLIYPPDWGRGTWHYSPRCVDTPTVDDVIHGSLPAPWLPRRPLAQNALARLHGVLSGTLWPPWRGVRSPNALWGARIDWADAMCVNYQGLVHSNWTDDEFEQEVARALERQYPGDYRLGPLVDSQGDSPASSPARPFNGDDFVEDGGDGDDVDFVEDGDGGGDDFDFDGSSDDSDQEPHERLARRLRRRVLLR